MHYLNKYIGIYSDASQTLESINAWVEAIKPYMVPKYFSDIDVLPDQEIEGSEYTYIAIRFYIDGVVRLISRQPSTSSYMNTIDAAKCWEIIRDNTTYKCISSSLAGSSGNVRSIAATLITDNAIVFYPYSGASGEIAPYTNSSCYPYFIYKSTTGRTIFGFGGSYQSGYYRMSITTSTGYLYQYDLLEDGPVTNLTTTGNVLSNTRGKVFAISYPSTTGQIPEGVAWSNDRDMATQLSPFLYTIDGVSYCGVYNNMVIIKTT